MKTIRRCVVAGAMGVVAVGPLAWAELDGASIELLRDGVLVDPATLGDRTSRLLDRDVVPGETYVYQARFVSDISGDVGPLGAEFVVTVPSNMPSVTATWTPALSATTDAPLSTTSG